MRYTFLLFTIALFTFTGAARAQPEVEWQRSYGGEDEDACFEAIQTSDGGYILVGYDMSFGPVDSDGWIVKTDEEGDSLWAFEFGGEETDVFYRVIQTEDRGYLLAGFSDSVEERGRSAWVVKINENGRADWSRVFGEPYFCSYYFRSVFITPDDCYSLAGINGLGIYDYYLIKINPDGETLWSHTYGGEDDENFGSHIPTTDEGYVIVGSTESFEALRWDAYLVKIDEDGEEEWYQTYGGRWNDSFKDIIQTQDGGYVIAGFSSSFEDNSNRGWLVKTDEDGELVWQRLFDGHARGGFQHILPAENGGFILAASRSDIPYLIRTDAEGEEQWSTSVDCDLSEDEYSIHITSDGGFIIGGTYNGDLMLVKLSPDPLLGAPAWQAIPDTSFNEDSSLELDIAYLFNYIRDMDDENEDLEILIEDGEHLFVERQNELLLITSDENWWGRDSLRLTVTDPDEHTASTYLSVRVNSINDPPGHFFLWYPENNSVVNSRRLVFVWEMANMNGYNEDMVEYTIRFSAGDQSYEVSGIEWVLNVESLVYYSIPDIEGLLDELGIDDIGDGVEIDWSVTAYDDSSSTECDAPFVFTIPSQWIANSDGEPVPTSFALHSAFPNPFNSTTTIRYELPYPANVSLSIYNTSGQQLSILSPFYKQRGIHTLTLSTGDLPSGLYFVRLEASGEVATQKVMLIR